MYSLENFYFPYRNKTLITLREFITKYDFFYENMHYKYLTGRHLLNNLLMAQLQKRSTCLQNHLCCAEGTLHFPKGNAQHSIVSVLEIWKSATTRSGSKLCKVTEWGATNQGDDEEPAFREAAQAAHLLWRTSAVRGPGDPPASLSPGRQCQAHETNQGPFFTHVPFPCFAPLAPINL